jgi:hypothetical protein
MALRLLRDGFRCGGSGSIVARSSPQEKEILKKPPASILISCIFGPHNIGLTQSKTYTMVNGNEV